MEQLIVYGIGLAAAAYIVQLIWKNATGKSGCHCSGASSCGKANSKNSCCGENKPLSK